MPVKTKTGISRGRIVEAPHRVQGIASSLDDLTIRGEKLKAVIGDALVGGTLARTIGGASTLTIEVLDINRHLLKSPLLLERHHLDLDGLGFGYVKARSEGRLEPMELTYEPNVVLHLKDPELMGPRKAFRLKVTRAEFAKRLVLLVKKPQIRFISPQLHVVQPIKSARDSRQRKQKADAELRKGLDNDAPVTVKGQPADSAQGDLGDAALRIAEEENAPNRVQVALIEALIVETEMGAIDPDNPLQATPASKSGTNEQDIRRFLSGGWGSYMGGAIKYFKDNPSKSPGQIAQAVQGSAFPGRYDEYAGEARKWVESYGGGEGSFTVTDFQKYAYEQKKNETIWACIGRLAAEVHWRRFESHGWIYFITDQDLLDSKSRLTITDYAKGIIDTSFDYDVGKEINEFVVTARAKLWTAPPGSVVEVKNHGPADGRYLVNRIEAPLAIRNSEVEITLHKPVEPLPEPPPSSKTRQVGGGQGTTGPGGKGALMAAMKLEGTPKEVVDSMIYFAREALDFTETPASVREANAGHGPTTSGSRSDHQGPPQQAWAADMASQPRAIRVHLAAAIAKAFNIPWSGSGLVTHEEDGYRMQLIHLTMEGGDHYDHVHFGVEA